MQALAIGLRTRSEGVHEERWIAIDKAEQALPKEGGVPVEDVRRDLHRWLSR